MSLVNLSDEELARRTVRGDPEAFEILVERHTPALYRIVRRMASDRTEAEAITQEAFLRAWEALPRSKTDRPFRPWLTQIAVNAARDALKKSRPLDFADLPEDGSGARPDGGVEGIADEVPGPEEQLEEAEALKRLAAAVQTLPAPDRMVIALRYEAEMPYEEIARALALPLNTVRTRLRRAKAKLREALKSDA